jgi:PAS domain S-box-containing protein
LSDADHDGHRTQKSDEALRESEEQYRTLVKNIPVGIYRSAPSDRERILMANQAFLTMFGFNSEEEAKEISMDDLCLKPEDHDVFMDILLSQGGVYGFEMMLKHQGGTLMWGSITARVVRGPDGLPSYFDCAIENITERTNRSQEREALISFAAILKTAQTRSDTVAAILDYLKILFNVEGNALVLTDENGGRFWVEASRGYWDYLRERRLQFDQTLSQSVISSGNLYVDWVKRDPLYGLPMPAGQQRVAICVPLATENKPIGALWLSRQAGFGESEVQLLVAIGDMAANALHRVLLHEQTQRRVQHLSALRAVDMAISASMDLRVVFNVLLEQLRTQLNVDAAAVLLLRPQMQTLEHAASRGFQTTAINQTRLRLSDRLVGRPLLEHRTMRIDNLVGQAEDFVRARGLPGEGFVVYYLVPLVVKGQLVGALELFHRSDLFPDKEWLDFLDMLAGQAAIAIDNATMFNDLQRSNMDLHLAYDTTLEGWVNALDLRVGESADHARHVTEVTVNLARSMGISEAELVQIRRGALLHDIGKMAIPDAILLKPGPLTDEEWQIMRRHPGFARDLLWPTGYLRPAVDIPYCHHERWDGAGYPRGLAGMDIPLSARIFAIVDVWDSLRSDRPYRKAWPEQQVQEYLQLQAGKHFDLEVVGVFFRLMQSGNLYQAD